MKQCAIALKNPFLLKWIGCFLNSVPTYHCSLHITHKPNTLHSVCHGTIQISCVPTQSNLSLHIAYLEVLGT